MIGIYFLMIGVGLFMISAAVFNWTAWFVDYDSRLIEAIGGERLVRWSCGILGLVIVVYVILTWVGVL